MIVPQISLFKHPMYYKLKGDVLYTCIVVYIGLVGTGHGGSTKRRRTHQIIRSYWSHAYDFTPLLDFTKKKYEPFDFSLLLQCSKMEYFFCLRNER